jgi:hypothetical protein
MHDVIYEAESALCNINKHNLQLNFKNLTLREKRNQAIILQHIFKLTLLHLNFSEPQFYEAKQVTMSCESLENVDMILSENNHQ